MSIVTALLKVLLVLVVAVAVFWWVVARYGVSETRYRCDGALDSTEAVVYLKVQLYNSWMFWANSGGIIWSEIPNQESDVYVDVRKHGDSIQFWTDDKKRVGSLSTLSNALLLYTRSGEFQGSCKRIEVHAQL